MLGIERAYRMFSEDLAHPRQVFITQSRVLVGKVEEHFFKYLESLNAGSPGHQDTFQRIRDRVVDDGFLVDEDDNEEWRNDLPQRYSELEDRHFPLFITFEAVSLGEKCDSILTATKQLCRMLQADICYKEEIEIASSQASTRTLPMMSSHRASALRSPGKLVNHDRFLSQYWSHFPQSLTKKLSKFSI